MFRFIAYVYHLILIYVRCQPQHTLMTSQGSDTVNSIFKCNSSNTITILPLLKWPSFHTTKNISLNFLASEFFGRQREFRAYTAGCVNKMAVSVTEPRAVNELGGPVIAGSPNTADTEQIDLTLYGHI